MLAQPAGLALILAIVCGACTLGGSSNTSRVVTLRLASDPTQRALVYAIESGLVTSKKIDLRISYDSGLCFGFCAGPETDDISVSDPMTTAYRLDDSHQTDVIISGGRESRRGPFHPGAQRLRCLACRLDQRSDRVEHELLEGV